VPHPLEDIEEVGDVEGEPEVEGQALGEEKLAVEL
jgi:hypothetical protein